MNKLSLRVCICKFIECIKKYERLTNIIMSSKENFKQINCELVNHPKTSYNGLIHIRYLSGIYFADKQDNGYSGITYNDVC